MLCDLSGLADALPTSPLPPAASLERSSDVPHAPRFAVKLTPAEFSLAMSNALRYFPAETHAELGQEFARELKVYGHIFMYRFRPTSYEVCVCVCVRVCLCLCARPQQES